MLGPYQYATYAVPPLSATTHGVSTVPVSGRVVSPFQLAPLLSLVL